MAALILPSRFMQQPQQAVPIDRASPLASGLAHCWGLNVAASRVAYNSASSAHGSFGIGNGGTSGNSWLIGQSGYYINYDATGTGTAASLALAVGDASGSGAPKSNVFSFAIKFRLSSLGSSPSALYGSLNAGGIEIRVDTTGLVQLLSQGVALVGASTGAISAGTDVDVVVTYDGATVSFYINGRFSGATASARTFLLGMQYYLGYASSSAEFLNVARLYRADIWNRVLTASEAAQWSSNPWQVFKAPTRRVWVASAGGGAGNSVSPATGNVSIVGLAPVVTQTANQSLAPNAGSLTLTGYAASVVRTANTSASPGNGALVLSGYAPTISQAVNVAISPLVGSLSITGYAPSVARTVSTSISLNSVVLALAGYAPTIAQTASSSLSPASGQVALTGYAPSVMQTAPIVTLKYRFISLKRDYNTDTIHFSG